MSKPRVVVIGINGQVGNYLLSSLSRDYEVLGLSRAHLDLNRLAKAVYEGNDDDIEAKRQYMNCLLHEPKPYAIINAAAYNEVEQAETDVEPAQNVNSLAPAILAKTAQDLGALFIHFSTDFVFDGNSSVPYTEESNSHPLNIYGSTKLHGDRLIPQFTDHYLILRTSWVYSPIRVNFFTKIQHLIHSREVLRVVGDQFGNPTFAKSIAQTVATILKQRPTKEQSGIYNFAGDGVTSWAIFAKHILDLEQGLSATACKEIISISSEEYERSRLMTIKRPKYSALDTTKIKSTFGIYPNFWAHDLTSMYVTDLGGNA